MQLYTKKIPLDTSVDLRAIAASCNGYVGADLEALCREAAMRAVQKSSETNEEAGMPSLTMEDWKHAKSVVGPSITRGVTVEIPKVSWEDIGGLKDLKVRDRQMCGMPWLFLPSLSLISVFCELIFASSQHIMVINLFGQEKLRESTLMDQI